MKNILAVCLFGIVFTSCNKPADETTINENQSETSQMKRPAVAEDAEVSIANSDCSACHNMSEKLVGPSYKEIAAKYPNSPENIDMLASKIINGGKGNWGEIPMAAHPSINEETAKAMVKYILAQK